MRIISLDPSLRSFGIFYNEDGEVNSEVIQREEKDRMDVLGWFCLKFAKEARLGWDLLIVESYAFGSANSRSITVQAEIGGLVRGLFSAYGVPIIEVPIGTWKSVTGISMKKGTPMHESDYLNAIVTKFGVRFKTVDEADAYLLYQTVMTCGARVFPGVGAANIRRRLEELKIDTRKLWRANER
ncbi:hypothetical protein [Tetrasphaera phage TJE1]|uniref:Uncharacterized protein n=1 Tax=Tetrasphaera phage TJE1 TaxID=981335 RepID=G4W996_9CAUD|nr:hypothetical protein G185_gp64 [Tetrasphaera phage TJE1]ADX42584.1 hypothetical protein [Tetrasphaera phage TJE1]